MITTNVMTKRKRSDHYVNNKDFLAALIKYREDVEIASLRCIKRLKKVDFPTLGRPTIATVNPDIHVIELQR